jgi:hypothetical protein
MTTRRSVLIGMAGMAAAATTGFPAFAQTRKATFKVVPATEAGGRVIILRGLYNVFSRGMDAIAKSLSELGVRSTLENHAIWKKIADEIIAQAKAKENVPPVILIGHSLGADATIVMANWLAFEGVPVRLAVTFDAVARTHPLTGNIQEVINFYKPKGYGQEVKAGKAMRGTIDNVDLTDRKDIDHLNIDKDKTLQAEVIVKVLEILKLKIPDNLKGTPSAGTVDGAKKTPTGGSGSKPVNVPNPPRKVMKKT